MNKILDLKEKDSRAINMFFLSTGLALFCLTFLMLHQVESFILSDFFNLFFFNFLIFNIFVMIFSFFRSISLNLDIAFEERLEVENMRLKIVFSNKLTRNH